MDQSDFPRGPEQAPPGARRDAPAGMFSGVVLSGGASRRMGRDKASLQLGGMSLLELQVEKLRELGIRDILLSGARCPRLPGTRVIPDILPGRGPLGGIYACLLAARCPACLVVSVDVPLVPPAALKGLRGAYRGGVCALRHRGEEEPLIAVYERGLAEAILPLIARGGAPVRALRERVPWTFWDYTGPEELLYNCNTPGEFAAVSDAAVRWGLPLRGGGVPASSVCSLEVRSLC